MFWQQHERISAGNKAHAAPESEPGELGGKDAARREDWTQHPRQRRGISSSWCLWKVGLSPIPRVVRKDAGGYFL